MSTFPATNSNEAVELIIDGGNQLHQIINEDATTEIQTESGPIPSVRKALADTFLFLDPIPWQQGSDEISFNQLRTFDNNIYWAPTATLSNPVPMGATPIGDSNWKLAPVDISREWILDEILKESLSSENRLVDGEIFKGSNEQYIQNGDIIPSGTTHLYVLIQGIVRLVSLSSPVEGEVNSLTEQGAVVDGVYVGFLNKEDSGKRKISILSWMFNPPQKTPVYSKTVDWSDTINSADEFCFNNGLTLYFPDGQYCITKNVQWKAKWSTDSRAAELAPFPQLDDEKRFLKDGYKHLLSGVSIVAMTGTYDTVVTQRGDLFSEMKPVVKTGERYPVGLNGGLAIIQDMEVLDINDNLTTPLTDNRSTGFDVGLLLDDSSACDIPNLTVFGYFNKAGTCIWSHGVGDNPDYNKFGFGSTSGYFGLALIANDSAAGDGPGLSGSQFIGFQLFGNDHHSRQPQILQVGQTNTYGHILLIDGRTAAANANINGHEFIAGGWRTYSNRPVILDNASNLHLTNVPFEFSEVSGQPDTESPNRFLATTNTFNVEIQSSRNCTYELWDHSDFGDLVNKLIIGNDFYGDTYWGQLGEYIGILSSGGGGEPRIIFTDTPSSSEQGFTIRKDTTSGNMEVRLGGSIVSGIDSNGLLLNSTTSVKSQVGGILDISGAGNIIQVSSVGDIDTIQPLVTNASMRLVGNSTSSFNLLVNSGNIRSKDGLDKTVSNQFDYIDMFCNGAQWVIL